MTLRLGVLVSGSGSNLQSIIDAIHSDRLDAEIKVVISNVPEVRALDRAERAGIKALCVDHREFDRREEFDERLRRLLVEHDVEWVVLAGFMRILTSRMLEKFKNRVLNIHPALLPAFPGTDAARQAIERGVTIAGCTIHIVDAGTDTGPILAQAAVPVFPEDDSATLTARIQEQEHWLYPRLLQCISEGRLRLQNERPVLVGLPPASGMIRSPNIPENEVHGEEAPT